MSVISASIIAEAGVNHNGSVERALAMVNAAADAGADVVKFQIFQAHKLAGNDAPMADYQRRNTGKTESQQKLLARLELPLDAFYAIVERCEEKHIKFLASPFDLDSLQFLLSQLKVQQLKIASGEITNGPLLLASAQSGCQILMSTGMATIEDIDNALSVLAFGYLNPNQQPDSLAACQQLLKTPEAKVCLQQKVILLHCTSQYPAPLNEVNLLALDSMAKRWGLPVGYSDHTQGLSAALAAVALGACCIEKHFTLDQTLPGPDHQASITAPQLAELIQGVREVSLARGKPLKAVQPSEESTRVLARKGLVAARDIIAGEPISGADLDCKRPATGISPMNYWDVLSSPAKKSYRLGEHFYG